ncbi:MAG: Holliday junction branch migration DNA helicase RuvB [Dehalococcoidia bacterium]|nr:Holliday junction branch migration DNA helicase RuvB [Dehalococcoidia bacterium]
MTDRLVSGTSTDTDEPIDSSLRPRRMADFVGQSKVKENLSIAIQAAKMRGEPLDHVIIYGPPGLGKTTLAHIIAQELEVSIKVTSGPAIERAGEMAAILTSISEGDVLFIDEVHRLSRPVEEVLYPAMEDYFLSWVVGKGLGARNINLRVNPFTLIGATTRFALVSPPLRDRFGSVFRMDYYDSQDMGQILHRSSRILDISIEQGGVDSIATRSRGTPRVANRLLKRIRDYAQVMGDGRITGQAAHEALEKLEVDSLGLDEIDHRLLDSIISKFSGGPVGLDTLAASIGEDADTIMDIYEPYLLQLGFLDRTPRGRLATHLAYSHLGKELPRKMSDPQGNLF